MHLCVPHACLVPSGGQKGSNRTPEPGVTDGCGLAGMWVPGTELECSNKRLACTLNHWSMSPALPWKFIQQDNCSSLRWMSLHIRHLGILVLSKLVVGMVNITTTQQWVTTNTTLCQSVPSKDISSFPADQCSLNLSRFDLLSWAFMARSC